MDIREYVFRKTVELVMKMNEDYDLGIELEYLEIEFSHRKTYMLATCWPNQIRIRYYTVWLIANECNTRRIDDLVIHECAHLVTGPDHDKRFRNVCRKYGAMYENKYYDQIPYHLEFPKFYTEKYGIVECN